MLTVLFQPFVLFYCFKQCFIWVSDTDGDSYKNEDCRGIGKIMPSKTFFSSNYYLVYLNLHNNEMLCNVFKLLVCHKQVS